jgi:hypothetical protein
MLLIFPGDFYGQEDKRPVPVRRVQDALQGENLGGEVRSMVREEPYVPLGDYEACRESLRNLFIKRFYYIHMALKVCCHI